MSQVIQKLGGLVLEWLVFADNFEGVVVVVVVVDGGGGGEEALYKFERL